MPVKHRTKGPVGPWSGRLTPTRTVRAPAKLPDSTCQGHGVDQPSTRTLSKDEAPELKRLETTSTLAATSRAATILAKRVMQFAFTGQQGFAPTFQQSVQLSTVLILRVVALTHWSQFDHSGAAGLAFSSTP